ncbi:BREX-1 system adenine-specific DNA-methyltransferase PglX [Arthrobacter sp. NPDC080031]|uniref:BREX-1 system adenine-specific DNA-methyltransferase PglX n=1 Tax=Arthrobacter sp. NPDC080031 TaxID=3155918 RepID=UPI00345028D9
METAPLKSFATWARTALIREVSARISVVLASEELRQEQPNAVAALEKAVNAAGGSDKGRDTIADKVAYTWFNRIIALRFMDAKAYTGIGVVSPERGREGGQPEVLAEAKRGNIDSAVVTNKRTVETITSLLNGTRRSDDPQGEAYALLLAEYCRHWNRSMPFMFEREGDYTELLIPANLLADDSVLARAANVLTEDVCQDVEVIGWLYQFYISERKDEVFAGFKKNKRAGAAEIPAATQLFTPHWIVRYLVENSLGRLWLLNRPNSGLVHQMDYYIAPVGDEADFLKISGPEELKIIDPACGSGHMLTYAFDLLYAIYEEEGYAPSDIPGLILTHNLYGTEIDPRAGALAAFALTMKARSRQRTFFNMPVQPNICALEPILFNAQELDVLLTASGDRHEEIAFWTQFAHADTFGSLIRPNVELTTRLGRHTAELDSGGDLMAADVIERAEQVVAQAEFLSPRYAVVITNPPYMGSGNMSAAVSSWIKETYPDEKQDLYACFIARGDDLVVSRGYVALITGDTWMTIKSFETLRRRLLANHAFLSFVHMHDVSNHPDIFGANTAFIIGKDESPETSGTYIYLDASSSDTKAQHLRESAQGLAPQRVFVAESAQFEEVPGAPLVFRISSAMRKAFHSGKPLSEVAQPRQGMATADNARFVRQWWEVSVSRCGFGCRSRLEAKSSGFRWFPYTDGGAFRRWYGNRHAVVNWGNDGEELRLFERSVVRNPELYFRESVTWSAVGSGIPAFRYTPAGSLFSNAGMSFFAAPDTLESSAAICNSTTAERLFAAIAPTLNLGVGEIGKLPIVDLSTRGALNVGNLVTCAKRDWDDFETSWDYARPSLLADLGTSMLLRDQIDTWASSWREVALEQQRLEGENNRTVAEAYGVEDEVLIDVPLHRVSLGRNVEFAYGPNRTTEAYASLQRADAMRELISYAVGCMFGRYSLDDPGLILADQGATLQDYLAKVPTPTFTPDADNVLPIVDGEWFEDDIVARFRQFLRAAFGTELFEDNLRFVTEALDVKDLRDYFVKSFYKDHVQRYKKRPIYWLFSSSKGSFNALIYMHRYTPSTVSTVLNEYLREFKAKLDASRQHHERLAAGTGAPRQQAAAQQEVDRLRKVLLELDEYEHDVLYPLATQQVQIDLDDGVKANYPKLGAALKKVPGLEASDE